MKTKRISFPVSDSGDAVSGEIIAPDKMSFLYVFAHGAGAGMDHPFMARLSEALAGLQIGTLRFNFPYMEKGSGRPDRPAVAENAVNRAIDVAAGLYPGIPLIAGGKSFGGRMTSQALSKSMKPQVIGIVFVGFPLHAAGSPGVERASHLKSVTVPMLFLQGTRDALADIRLTEGICKGLPNTTLRKFEGADHSFKAGKQDLIPMLAQAIQDWSANFVKH